MVNSTCTFDNSIVANRYMYFFDLIESLANMISPNTSYVTAVKPFKAKMTFASCNLTCTSC